MIEDYLNSETFTTKKELRELTGYTDRTIRRLISDLKAEKPVIYNSQTSGYRLAKDFSKLTEEEKQEELRLIRHCIADIESRKKAFDMQLRSYIAYLKKAEE